MRLRIVARVIVVERKKGGIDFKAWRDPLFRAPANASDRPVTIRDARGDARRKVVFDGEKIGVRERTVECGRPQMGVRFGVDELGGQAQRVVGLPDAAFENVIDVKRLADLADRDVAIGEGRCAGDDGKFLKPAERRDQLFRKTVCEAVVFRLP